LGRGREAKSYNIKIFIKGLICLTCKYRVDNGALVLDSGWMRVAGKAGQSSGKHVSNLKFWCTL
jgi:hypothetical protein